VAERRAKLPIAVIGAGWVTTHRHVPALLRHPRVELVGVVDRSEVRGEALASRLGIRFAPDLDAPWIRGARAVVIGTSPEAHAPMAIAALERGLHVLVEKPFAMTPAEGRRMIDAASRARCVLAVVHNFQFARSVTAARRRLESGAAGELRAVLGLQLSNPARRLPEWYRNLPLGLFYDEAPHLMYLLRAFVDDFRLTRAAVAPSAEPADPTPVVVSTVHASGRVVGTTQMIFAASLSEWQLVLMASKETLACDIFRDVLVRIPGDGRHEGADVLRTSLAALRGHVAGTFSSGWRHAFKRLDYGNGEVVRRFVEAIETGTVPREISAEDGLAVVEALHGVLATTAT
jgi:scyllo-inositol 2-dehydrogenase (NADP+)